MGSAKVIMNEVDLTEQIPMFPGVYGGIVLPARKGPLEPYLATSVTDLKRVFTPDAKIDIVDDLAFFSAQAYLQKSDKLWVSRAVNAALYGGATVEKSDSVTSNAAYAAGEADPETDHVFGVDEVFALIGSNPGAWINNIAVQIHNFRAPEAFTTTYGTDLLTVTQFWATGLPILVNSTTTLPSPLAENTVYYVINVSDTTIKLATTAANAALGIAISLSGLSSSSSSSSSLSSSSSSSSVSSSSSSSSLSSSSISSSSISSSSISSSSSSISSSSISSSSISSISSSSSSVSSSSSSSSSISSSSSSTSSSSSSSLVPGTVTVHTISLVEQKASEVNLFYIGVYKDGGATPVEEWQCSRQQIKDGYGRNAYIEDVLEGSNYIRAVDNTSILAATLPLDQLTSLSLGAGSDGSAVTDSHMITALNRMSNPNDVPLTILMDGGWTTVAYAQALYGMAAARDDCYAHLSTPYAAEASSNYLNEVVKYRKVTLNANNSYAGLCSPHVYIYDTDNDRKLYVSPDGFFAAQMCETGSNNEMWVPGAGYTYGIIEVLTLLRKYSEPEMDYLYDNQINPIKFTPGRGIAIWGQKTLLGRPSYLQNSAVRMMLIVVKPAIKLALEDYLWQGNTDSSRAAVRTLLTSYMEWIRARDGVVRFEIVCDRTNNLDADIAAGRIVVWVLLEPVVPVETIECTIGITSAGYSFDLAAQNL